VNDIQVIAIASSNDEIISFDSNARRPDHLPELS